MKSLFDVIDNPPEVFEYLPPAKVRQLTAEELVKAAYEASKVLGRLVKDPEASQSQIRACQVVLDRAGFGPSQSIAIDDTTGILNVELMTPDQLAHRAMLIGNSLEKSLEKKARLERMNGDDVHQSSHDDDNDDSSPSSVH